MTVRSFFLTISSDGVRTALEPITTDLLMAASLCRVINMSCLRSSVRTPGRSFGPTALARTSPDSLTETGEAVWKIRHPTTNSTTRNSRPEPCTTSTISADSNTVPKPCTALGWTRYSCEIFYPINPTL